MKKITPKYRLNFGRKTKLLALLGSLIIASGFTISILRAVNDWFDTYTLSFNRIIEIQFNEPIEVKKREIPATEIIEVVEKIPEPQDLETDIEKKIYEVFGIENYKMAIAIAKAESHLNCDALGVNSNGSVDIGVFQINSSWLKDYSLSDLANCSRNIEIAYEIWDRADGEIGNGRGSWSPWTVARNGAFIKFLK